MILLSMVALPLVGAGVAAAAMLLLGATEMLGTTAPTEPIAVLLDVAKFCYLGVAMAHLSRGLAERTDGGLASQSWWNPWGQDGEDIPAYDAEFWHRFPNHFDGAAIGMALTLMLTLI